MEPGIPERRRSVRVVVDGSSSVRLPAAWPVQLLDLSLGGAAFASPHRLEPGRTVAVRTTLAGAPFNAELQVCWARLMTGRQHTPVRFEVGAKFLPLDESSRRALVGFLKLSPAG